MTGIETLFEDYFDDYLDECHEPVVLGGVEYAYSVVLKRVDPIAYRCALSDFESFYSDE